MVDEIETDVLSPEQRLAAERVMAFIERPGKKDWFSVGGFAGTGKSYLMAYLLSSGMLNGLRVGVAGPTGRSAMILQKMGAKAATTLHSTYYHVVDDGERLNYVLKGELPVDVLFVDETSMVATPQHEDGLTFVNRQGLRLIYFGDIGQLKPVGDDPRIMERPDVTLTEVHRQAKKSPIIRLVTDIRMGRNWYGKDYKNNKHGKVSFGRFKDFLDASDRMDLMIVGSNKTRVAINDNWRASYGYKKVLHVGEKVICKRNNRQQGVFNGLVGKVEQVLDIDKHYTYASIVDELGNLHPACVLYTPTIKDGVPPQRVDASLYRPDLQYWTYAYSLTAHTAQGGQARRVAVHEEVFGDWDLKRWAYTSASRAEYEVLYCRN